MRRPYAAALLFALAVIPAHAGNRLHEYAMLIASQGPCNLPLNSAKAIGWLKDGGVDVNSGAVATQLGQLVMDVGKRIVAMDATTLAWHCGTMRDAVDVFDLSP